MAVILHQSKLIIREELLTVIEKLKHHQQVDAFVLVFQNLDLDEVGFVL